MSRSVGLDGLDSDVGMMGGVDEGVEGSEEVFVEDGEREDSGGGEKQANKKYLGVNPLIEFIISYLVRIYIHRTW
jgi:hypothetical protein